MSKRYLKLFTQLRHWLTGLFSLHYFTAMILNWDFPSGIKCDNETSNYIVVFWDVAVSRPVLGPTQPPIQWMLGIFTLG